MKRLNYWLILITVVLILISIAMVYSASSNLSYFKYKDSYYLLKRHLFSILVSIPVFFFFYIIDYRCFKSKKLCFIYSSCVVLLLLCFLFPYIRNMPTRWTKVGWFSFQPAELAKLAIVMYLAWFLSKYNHLIKKSMRWVLYSLALPGMTILLILLQPHLGMSALLFSICIILLFVAGARMLHILPIILISLIILVIVILHTDYMKRRMINPWSDPQGRGYQQVQSLICLGSGNLFGKGIGRGEGKLLHLPIPYADSIFAVIGEEFGFVGSLCIISLFLLYFLIGMKISKLCKDSFGYFLSVGFTNIIILQAILNICVITGILPVTGLPLPFLSFGGSFLVVCVAQTAILANIYKINNKLIKLQKII